LNVGFVIVSKKNKEKASDALHVKYAELVIVWFCNFLVCPKFLAIVILHAFF